MKTVVVLFALFVVSLAAPSEVEKVAASEGSEKPVEEAVNSSSQDEVLEKIEPEVVSSPEVESPEEKKPVIAEATTSVEEEEKTDEEKLKEEEKRKIHQENRDICRASTGATLEQIKEFGQNPSDDAPKAVKCYVKCITEAYGVEKDEVLQKDIALRNKPSSVTVEEFEKAVEDCAELKTDDPCDSAYLRYSCYFRSTGEKVRLH